MTESVTCDDLVRDDADQGVFRVHRSAFVDPAILARERERIFARCWIYVGHTSEVPHPGDFLTRTVVGHPLVLVHDVNGTLRAFFNTCPHQGSMICRVPRGSGSTLQCFFHGWTFDTTGKLVGGAARTGTGYGGAFDSGELGLRGPHRLESYRGFVFMNLDAGAPPLRDDLGRAADYLDLVVDESPTGMEVVPGSHRYSTRANWKMLVMNSMDGYHVATTHATYFQYLKDHEVDLSARRLGARYALGGGHTAAEFVGGWGRPVARWAPPFPPELRDEIDAQRLVLEARHGAERSHRIADIDRNLFIFPNLVVLDHSAITIRTFQPIGPDRLEVSTWALAPIGESPALRSARLANYLTFWGPAGFATPDDIEALEVAQRAFANAEVAWSDLSKGALTEARPDLNDNADELQLRAFWRGWRDRMRQHASPTP